MQIRDTRFNPPVEMWARFVYISRFFCLFAAIVFGVIALREPSPVDAIRSGFFLYLMIAGHRWLKRTGYLEKCDRSFDAVFSGADHPEDELDQLLHRREALEERRGKAGFDPWEVQIVRREINEYVRKHPESLYRLDQER